MLKYVGLETIEILFGHHFLIPWSHILS